MTLVYVFSSDRYDRNVADSKLKKGYVNGRDVERYSLPDFIEALNDENINIDINWVRMIDDNEGCYPISSVHKDDLKDAGFNTKNVSDSDMKYLADKMSDDYCEYLFWESLKTNADYIGIPRQKAKVLTN